jgi:hypothetical protein
MATLARIVHVLVIALWAGAGLFVLAVLAPEATHVVQIREDALSVLSLSLERLAVFGLIGGPLAMATLALGWLPLRSRIGLRTVALVLMTAATAATAYYRTFDELDPRVPLGAQVSILMLGVVVALACAVLGAAVTARPKKNTGIEVEL